MTDKNTSKEANVGRFDDLGIMENLLVVLKQKGFDIPTPIQHQVIPSALQGKDIVGIAQTGTGKTLAFAIPIIQHLARNKGQGLVLVPTRELAQQIYRVFQLIGGPLGLRCAVVIGGASQFIQVSDLKRNPHVVIATPGRLDDLMKQGKYRLDKVSIVILDEADRMLDVGFLPHIQRILEMIPKGKQVMLFSATMPKSISFLASKFMKMPLRIEIAPQGTSAENVEQEVFVVTKTNKTRLLDSLLQQYKEDKILIFSRTKHGAKRITRDIRDMGHTSTEIHSNRTQAQRKTALDGFTIGMFRIMVATDIAARGIDVKDISIVINFDLPDNSEDYVHRIGRTGRAGKYGKAISFVTSAQKFDVKKIERLIRKSLTVLSLPVLPPERQRSPEQEEPRYQSRNLGRSSQRGNGGYRRSRDRGQSRDRDRSSNFRYRR